MPSPRSLTSAESASVHHFLLLRHQIHASPLYTSKRASSHDPTAPRKTYGQAQANALYDVKNKASVDPFTAVPTYSQRFVREERSLPDWAARPVCRELFPPELLDTVDPPAAGAGRSGKRRRLELSSVSALPSAEEAFGIAEDADRDAAAGAGDETGGRSLLERLDEMRGEEDDEGPADADEDEVGEEDQEDQDEVYDDEDAGDYDAENYFDNGDELGDDNGDGDDGEGTF